MQRLSRRRTRRTACVCLSAVIGVAAGPGRAVYRLHSKCSKCRFSHKNSLSSSRRNFTTPRELLSPCKRNYLKNKKEKNEEGVCARESRHAARLPSRLPGAAPPFLPCLRARQEGDDYPVRPAVYDPQQTHTPHTNIERNLSLSNIQTNPAFCLLKLLRKK